MRSKRESNPAKIAWTISLGLIAFAVAFGAGCGGSDEGAADTTPGVTKVGKGEGKLNLIAWAGYVEDGTNYPESDWVTPFEKETGCQVSVKVGGSSDEMVELMRSGGYDGVSASGDASLRLIEGGDVQAVDTSLVPNYKTVFEDLKDQSYNTVDGTNYGIPHGRGANLLIWNKDKVKPAPTSWDVLFDPKKAAKYKGAITAYDSPIYIADAALYLSKHEPDLGITDVYELDQKQFDAAIALLKEQAPNVGEYWSDALKQISAFKSGDDLVGTTWQYQYFALQGEKAPVETIPASAKFLPSEGSTGWSDTWMVSKDAAHPNCMYKWMDYVISPKVNAEIAEFFGEAPAQSKACDFTSDKGFCGDYQAADPAFWSQVKYWRTPISDCGDDRGSVCKTYDDWVQGWNEVKG